MPAWHLFANKLSWRHLTLATVSLAAFATPAIAELISTPLFIYEDADRNPTSVPFLLGGSPNHKLFARFDVPDAPLIVELNSFMVLVTARDDDDPAVESGSVSLGAGQNEIFLGTIVDPPNSPTVYKFELNPVHFADAIASMQNNDRVPIQIQRTDRDFFIDEVVLQVDAELIPEPAPFVLLATLALLSTRRR